MPDRKFGQRARAWSSPLAWGALFLVLIMLVVWPLVNLQGRAFSDEFAGFRAFLSLRHIGRTLWTTVVLAVGSVVFAVPAGTALAWAASRLSPRMRRVFAPLPLVPLLVPAVAAVTGWAFLLAPRTGYLNSLLRRTPLFDHLTTGPLNAYSVPMIVVVTGVLMTSFVYMFIQTGLNGMGQEFEAAGAANGAGPVRRFFTIVLPLLRPAIVYSSGFVLLVGLGQFTAPLLLGRQRGINVLTTELFVLVQDFPVNYGLGAAIGSPLILAGALIVVLQRWLIGDQRRFVTVGSPTRFGGLTSRRAWPVVLISAYLIVVVVLPLAALTYVALSEFWTGTMSFDGLTLRHVEQVLFRNRFTREAIKTSVLVSGGAVLVVVPLGFLAALALLRRTKVKAMLREGIDVAATLPLGVPTALLGFAFLFTFTQPPLLLYGSLVSIIVVYVTLMIPHAVRFQLTSLIGAGEQAWEASRANGAGPLRTLVRVVIPMARDGIGAASAIIIVLLFHEFAASLMVRSASLQVMGTVLYDLWSAGTYPQVAVMALIMTAVAFVGVLLALRIGGSSVLRNLQ